MKRLFDLVVSAAGLLAFSPIALLIAIAIKLDDGGPVFFSQERVGLGGRHVGGLVALMRQLQAGLVRAVLLRGMASCQRFLRLRLFIGHALSRRALDGIVLGSIWHGRSWAGMAHA